MSDVQMVCTTCGKEKIYCTFEEALQKGWTLGLAECCPKCKPETPPMPRHSKEWYQFYYYLALLKGNMEDNLELDRIRRSDPLFMSWWNGLERPETWVEDTLVHWHVYPEDFSWEKYNTDRSMWLKYNASLEQRAHNYWYMVKTFQGEHIDYWCYDHLEIY